MPVFLLGTLALVGALVTREGVAAVFAVAGMGVSVLLQGRGHRRERETPAPFAGAGDFVSRFFVEQWVTFPRFGCPSPTITPCSRGRPPRTSP